VTTTDYPQQELLPSNIFISHQKMDLNV